MLSKEEFESLDSVFGMANKFIASQNNLRNPGSVITGINAFQGKLVKILQEAVENKEKLDKYENEFK